MRSVALSLPLPVTVVPPPPTVDLSAQRWIPGVPLGTTVTESVGGVPASMVTMRVPCGTSPVSVD
jgi:hypothetical protein